MLQYFIDPLAYKLVEYGYLAIFKRSNVTSAEELDLFKAAISKVINVKNANVKVKGMHKLKAGHGGTLDKMATGVLEHVTKAMIEDKLKRFIGEIFQKPPIYSALKRGGRRVSDIARAKESDQYGFHEDKPIEMEFRPVTCYDVKCVDFKPPYFSLEVTCGKGFYVRSLINDLTKDLGSCGHVTSLLRTKHGQFTLDDCLHAADYSMAKVVDAVKHNRRKFPMYSKNL
ncbi:pseudouridylate synthase TRUB1-like [Macrosteles quadrilineatus]|uniref:pseudouridylate synthase TRUB1-like n=1 Tax=Macrosteles quadrilineatus TaxID=74068 RepID=UPI0023E21338|nr:pseudouridylate synthase TRUB1-like [Macrosteles quadrilineatus]